MLADQPQPAAQEFASSTSSSGWGQAGGNTLVDAASVEQDACEMQDLMFTAAEFAPVALATIAVGWMIARWELGAGTALSTVQVTAQRPVDGDQYVGAGFFEDEPAQTELPFKTVPISTFFAAGAASQNG